MGKIEEFKEVQDRYNKAVSDEKEFKVELNMLKKQSLEILKSYGYSSFNDLASLKAQITELEEQMQTSIEEMEKYIAYVNKKKEEKDNILLG